MNELSLFSGAGGGLLASKIIGWRTVCAVELDWYNRCVLVQRQNDGILRPAFPIWDDIRKFDGRAWRGKIDVVTGGFPCQAFSTAARGRNNADDLWPEMRRVIDESEPKFVFAENVSRTAIDTAADDLEKMGYKTKAISLSAEDLGADHIRERYWLLAYADDKSKLLCGLNAKMEFGNCIQTNIWQTFSDYSRMDDGVADRMERYKATGNGQIPAVAIAALIHLVNLFD